MQRKKTVTDIQEKMQSTESDSNLGHMLNLTDKDIKEVMNMFKELTENILEKLKQNLLA